MFGLPIGATFQKDRNGVIAALTGFPAIEVPAGFLRRTLDVLLIGVTVGIEVLGRAWDEPELISSPSALSRQRTYGSRPFPRPPCGRKREPLSFP